ncbi:MAG: uroporphyrinogen decarboxylase family protein [Pseudomonadota bacterium]
MEQFFHCSFPLNALPAANLAGVGIDTLSHDAKLKAKATISYYQEVPADLLFFFSDIAIQAEAMGATLNFSPESMPSVAAPARQVRLPRAADVPRMRMNAQVLKAMRRELPRRPSAALVYGPFTVAGQVAGEQEVLRGVVERPDEVHALLDQCLDLALDYAALMLEQGAEVLWVADPLAALLPPESFWDFAGGYLSRLFAFKGDRNTALHICGDTSQIVEPMLQTGVGGISFDQCMDLLAIEDRIPSDVAIIGNLEPVEILEQASPQEVVHSTEELVMSLGVLPNFVLSSGCGPPPGAPVANIKAFVQSGQRSMAHLAPHADRLLSLCSLVFHGKRQEVPALVNEIREQGAKPMTILRAGLMRAVKKGSALYEAKCCYLPAVLLMVDAFYPGYRVLQAELAQSGANRPAVALGTVQGDFHEIGKNLVAIMLEANGVGVKDLGVNVTPAMFVQACREDQCRVVGLSAFITSARHQLGAVKKALAAAGMVDVKMVTGGAAVNQHLAGQAGMHGYAKDAVAAVRLVKKLMKESA